jgi:hypothetical protein
MQLLFLIFSVSKSIWLCRARYCCHNIAALSEYWISRIKSWKSVAIINAHESWRDSVIHLQSSVSFVLNKLCPAKSLDITFNGEISICKLYSWIFFKISPISWSLLILFWQLQVAEVWTELIGIQYRGIRSIDSGGGILHWSGTRYFKLCFIVLWPRFVSSRKHTEGKDIKMAGFSIG